VDVVVVLDAADDVDAGWGGGASGFLQANSKATPQMTASRRIMQES
jgi:hypothetical protein